MLGKLIKYEWLQLWKIPTGIIVFINVMAVAVGMIFTEELLLNESHLAEAIISMIMILFVSGIIAATFGSFFYFAIRFYKSTYSDEGYLLHTLPVTARQILISKITVISIWQILIALGVISSVFIAVFVAAVRNVDIESLIAGWNTIKEELAFLWKEEGKAVINFLIVSLLSNLVRIIYVGVFITASVNIGQLMRKHRVGGAILTGVGISIVLSTISNVVRIPWFINEILTGVDYMDMLGVLWISLAGMTIFTLALYLVGEYVMRKKLNLE